VTGPAQLDYPDYTRTFASARNLLDVILSKAITASDVSGAIATGNIHSVGCRIIANVTHVRITLDWFVDQALTSKTSTDVIDVRQGQLFDQTIPVKGAYLRRTADGFPGAACTYSLLLYEMPTGAVPHNDTTTTVLFNSNGTSRPAGVSGPFEAGRVYAGNAVGFVSSDSAAAWSLLIETIQADATVRLLARIDNTSPRIPFLIHCPPLTTRWTLNNGAAGNQLFWISLVALPFYPPA
jgi:hypothetical protein